MKTIVLSGANAGIGKAAFLELLNRGYRMIGLSRSGEKIESFRQELSAHYPEGSFHLIQADLSSRKDIFQACAEIRSLADEGLYALINNAASFASSYTETPGGIELQLAVNALAPFLLSRELLPLMSEGSRIITVGSSSHRRARLHWNNPGLKGRYYSLGAYRQAKFFNILLTEELNRRLIDRKIRAFIADPGLVNTAIGSKGSKGLSRLVWSIRRQKGQTPEEGASTAVYLADTPVLPEESYYKYSLPFAPDPRSSDPEIGRRFWTLAENLCG